HIVDVRNFQFIARAGLGPCDFLEDCGIVEIDAGNGEIGFWILRFFLDTKNSTIGNLGTAETLWIRNFLEKNVRSGSLLRKMIRGADDVVLDDVVAQNDADLLAFNERFSKTQRVRDSAFSFLVGVMNAM